MYVVIQHPLNRNERTGSNTEQTGRLKNRKELSLTPKQHHDSFLMGRLRVAFLVCLWCPDMKPLVVFPDWLDWCWRHMALIRLFNLSPVTMPRIRRLIEFADGLSWYKTFERHFFNYLCMFCPLQQMCVCVFLFISVCERVVCYDWVLLFMTEIIK